MDPALPFEGGWELDIAVDPHDQRVETQYVRLSRDDGTVDIQECDFSVRDMTNVIEIIVYRPINSSEHLQASSSHFVPVAALKAFVLQYEALHGEIKV